MSGATDVVRLSGVSGERTLETRIAESKVEVTRVSTAEATIVEVNSTLSASAQRDRLLRWIRANPDILEGTRRGLADIRAGRFRRMSIRDQ